MDLLTGGNLHNMDVVYFVNLLAEKFGMPTRKKSREQRLAERLLRGANKGALSEARATIQEGAQVNSDTFSRICRHTL